jgi:hypothetical protein
MLESQRATSIIDGCHTEPNNVDPTLGPYLPYPKWQSLEAHTLSSLYHPFWLVRLPQPQVSVWLSGSQLLTFVVLAHFLPHRERLLVGTSRVFIKLAFLLVEEALHTISVCVSPLLFFMCDFPCFMFFPAFRSALCFSVIQYCLRAIAVHGTMHTR